MNSSDKELNERLLQLTRDASFRDLRLVDKYVKSELLRREKAYISKKESDREGFKGLINFMTGVVQAMALRQLLRWSKGHIGLGTSPAGGEPWRHWEIINASVLLTNTCINSPSKVGGFFRNDIERINPFYTRLDFWNLSRLQSVLRNYKPKEY